MTLSSDNEVFGLENSLRGLFQASDLADSKSFNQTSEL